MKEFQRTRLWQNTLASDSADSEFQSQRDTLREVYFQFRERASKIAQYIEADLPNFTVHDITHIDALWETASLIASPNFPLTPAEGFVLGGAFLIHDLGMSLAAYPNGVGELKQHPDWEDTVASVIKSEKGNLSQDFDYQNADTDIESKAIRILLREIHAERAEEIVRAEYEDPETGDQYHLLERPEIRRNFGHLIGKIARSHWWSVDQLEEKFESNEKGTPGSFPNSWTVDPLKLACLLRAADASHLDERRAPRFLNAIRSPAPSSQIHWTFQRKLNQPTLDADRLRYTSVSPFSEDQAEAWWQCYDALSTVDQELKAIDALLADLGKQRLDAKGVARIENPDRFSEVVEVDSWVPVDTQIQVSDVASLVESLGGKNLYGQQHEEVPLRELVQNAADAIRARRSIEDRDTDWGRITVRLGEDDSGLWIEVEDDGVGMSTDVLSTSLLDFGQSGWDSDTVRQEFTGLLSSDFEPTGQFGIGFFSVFMWGEEVKITSRRYDKAQKDTHVLKFDKGLDSRPMLRDASKEEYIRDGGTRIKVWLDMSPTEEDSILTTKLSNEDNIYNICKYLFPSLDVDLYTKDEINNDNKLCIKNMDWASIDIKELLKRSYSEGEISSSENYDKYHSTFIKNSTLITDDNGDPLARGCIAPSMGHKGMTRLRGHPGVVTVGGLRSRSLSGIAGIFPGSPVTASRDSAVPDIQLARLSEWASDQAEKIADSDVLSPEAALECAQLVRALAGNTNELPIGFGQGEYLTFSEVIKRYGEFDEVLIPSYFKLKSLYDRNDSLVNIDLLNNVIYTRSGWPALLQGGHQRRFTPWPSLEEWDEIAPGGNWGFHSRSLVGAIVEALSTAWESDIQSVASSSFFSSDERKEIRTVGSKNTETESETLEASVQVIRNPE